jgi:hypothetical protein
VPGCRIFHVPREDSSKAAEISIDNWRDPEAGDSKDQVMVFQYNGKFVAVNHVCFLLSLDAPLETPQDFGHTNIYKLTML